MSTIVARGWCPSALRPMETGDGYLVRLRVANGSLSFALADEIAALSLRFGNGLIDLSARGNLQLRGVAAKGLDGLWARLADVGLLDADPAVEATRNVVPSPLAGFDDSAALDARPLVAALEARLTQETALRALPAKFGFLVDGGGVAPLTGVEADIGLHAFVAGDRPRLAVRLGGSLAGSVSPDEAPDVAIRIGHAFLGLRADERRMGALVERVGVAAIARRASICADVDAPAPPRPVDRRDLLGVHTLGGASFVGAAVAFGQLRAQSLRQLAERAERHGAAELRLSPWRAVFAVGLRTEAARALAGEVGDCGFIVEGDDPRLALAACSGRPACASAHADVRSAALSLAPLLAGYKGMLHVSGCPKGCAHPARAPVTFVAAGEGYDLVENGLARDEPSSRGLSLAALAAYLESHGVGAAG